MIKRGFEHLALSTEEGGEVTEIHLKAGVDAVHSLAKKIRGYQLGPDHLALRQISGLQLLSTCRASKSDRYLENPRTARRSSGNKGYTGGLRNCHHTIFCIRLWVIFISSFTSTKTLYQISTARSVLPKKLSKKRFTPKR